MVVVEYTLIYSKQILFVKSKGLLNPNFPYSIDRIVNIDVYLRVKKSFSTKKIYSCGNFIT